MERLGGGKREAGGRRQEANENTASRLPPPASWRLLYMGENSAAFNMAVDDALLRRQATHPQPILRLYEWEAPSFSLGYFQDLEELSVISYQLSAVSRQPSLHRPALSRPSSHPPIIPQLTRRPTGGGTVIHDGALTFSVIAPLETPGIPSNVLDSYRAFSDIAVAAFRKLGVEANRVEDCPECEPSLPNFCLLRPTQHDVAFQGKKVVGAAQRRTRDGLLHQAYVVLRFPSRETFGCVECQEMETAARRTTLSLEEAAGKSFARDEVAEAMVDAFQDVLGIGFEEQPLTGEEMEATEIRLKEVYGREEWVFGDRRTRKRIAENGGRSRP